MSGLDEIPNAEEDSVSSVIAGIEYVGESSVIYQLLDDTKKLAEYLKDEITRGRVSLGFIRAIMPFGIDMYTVERCTKFPEYYYKTLALMVQEMLVNNLQIHLRTPWGREISQDVIPHATT